MLLSVSIVLPTYNEAENIRKLVHEIFKYVPKAELVIVDDNSPDGTGKIADDLQKRMRNIKVLHRYDKKGLGSAIIDGLMHAKGDIIGVMDSDFSHPPQLLPVLIKKIDEGYDFVIASRYVKGSSIENWPKIRKLTSKIAIALARSLTGIKDPVSGFFFMRNYVIKNVALSPRSWKVSLDIIVKGKYSKTAEVPFTFRNRKEGKSKIAVKEYVNYILHILELMPHRICRIFRKNNFLQ